MENEKLKLLHKQISDCIYNIESGTHEYWQKHHAAGAPSKDMLLVESSRKQIHSLIDNFINENICSGT